MQNLAKLTTLILIVLTGDKSEYCQCETKSLKYVTKVEINNQSILVKWLYDLVVLLKVVTITSVSPVFVVGVRRKMFLNQ